MKKIGLVGLVLLAACGTEREGPPGSEIDCRSLQAIDRLSLLGPGDSRRLVVLAALEAPGPLTPVDLGSVASEHGRAVLDRGRVVALSSGSDVLELELGACRASIEIEVLIAPPFAREVLSFEPGLGAGFGADRFPEIVFGPPHGGGQHAGSVDVLSLGVGGRISLGFADLVAYDGPGPDLIVFENAFSVPGSSYNFVEPAELELGQGGDFERRPCDARAPPHQGCVGLSAVLAGFGPGAPAATDPVEAGGDAIDLEGRTSVVDSLRLTDVTTATTGTNSGFDLDAVALIHAIPNDAESLAASPMRLSMRVGERSLLPRIDVRASDGRTVFGIEPKVDKRSGRSIEIDEFGLLATEPGLTQIDVVAGEMKLNLEVMVEQ